jgi:hypothetical protein
MHSFVDFKKQKLEKKLSNLTIQEALEQHLDILRLEAVQAIKLPELLTESNLIKKSAYDFARKQDYDDHKEMVNLIISELKNNMFVSLIAEAEAATAVAPVVSLDGLKRELKSQIKQLVDDLKTLVQTELASSRQNAQPTAQAAPSSGTTSAPQPQNASDQGEDSLPMTQQQRDILSQMHKERALPLPQNFDRLTRAQASDLYGKMKNITDEPIQTNVPAQSKGAWWSRPEGGYLRGLSRLVSKPWQRFWRQRKRDYWNDQTLESCNLNQIFFENAMDVAKVFDAFEKNVMKLIDDKIDQIVSFAKGGSAGPSSGGPSGDDPTGDGPSPKNPSASNGKVAPVQPRQGSARPPEDSVEDDSEGDAQNQGNIQNQTQSQDQGQDQTEGGIQIQEEKRNKRIVKGVELLGLQINPDRRGPKGGLSIALDTFLKDGKPLVSDAGGSSLMPLRNSIYTNIYNVLNRNQEKYNIPQERMDDIDATSSIKTKSEKKRQLVREMLGIDHSRAGEYGKDIVKDLLSQFYLLSLNPSRNMQPIFAKPSAAEGETDQDGSGDAVTREPTPSVAKEKTIKKSKASTYPNTAPEFLTRLEQDEEKKAIYSYWLKQADNKPDVLLSIIGDALDTFKGDSTKTLKALSKQAAEDAPAKEPEAAPAKEPEAAPAKEPEAAPAKEPDEIGPKEKLENEEVFQKALEIYKPYLASIGKSEQEINELIENYKNQLVKKIIEGGTPSEVSEMFFDKIKIKIEQSGKQKANDEKTIDGIKFSEKQRRALEEIYSDKNIDLKQALEESKFENSTKQLIEWYLITQKIDEKASNKKIKALLDGLLKMSEGEVRNYLDAVYEQRDKLEDDQEYVKTGIPSQKQPKVDLDKLMGTQGKTMSNESFRNTLEKFRRMINS